jgi:monovalent cation/hydrogen antiporter
MHGHVELLLLGLMLAVAGLSILAGRIGVPYPILLVLGGLSLGFVPGVPALELPPELVLVLFLPPLLHYAAFFSSPRDLLADARIISLLAVGLVLVTMSAVAVTAHAVLGLPWGVAWVLGAIVSPTDALAATSIVRRLGAPRRLVTVLEGESLVNDATALVAYRVAVAAALGGGFSLWEAGLRFLGSAAGGVVIGLAVGWVFTAIRRWLDDPPVEIVVSLVPCYAAYLPAERLGVSGVLATVTAGLYIGWHAHLIASPRTRLLGFSFWEVLVYLLNAMLFILVGLQLQPILTGVTGEWPAALLGQAALVSGVVIAARIAWQFTVPYIIQVLDRRPRLVARRLDPRQRLVIGWSGMRGALSLAAALALPTAGAAGQAFQDRNRVVFLTFAVIFVTLVLQGLTLPTLVRRLRIRDDGAEEEEELYARLAAADAALARLDELARDERSPQDKVERLWGEYHNRRKLLKAQAGILPEDGRVARSRAYKQLHRDLIDTQRRTIIRLRNQGEISNDVMHRVERDLDLEETRLGG